MSEKSIEKIGGSHLWRLLAFLAFGATTFTTASTRFNPVYIGFGFIFLVFVGWLYRHFLITILKIFNPIIKKEVGKKAISIAVGNSMLFLIPFAVMSLIATYYLKWSMTSVFISTGIMSVGTASSIELNKLREKSVLRNTVLTMFVSFLFTLCINVSVQLLSKVPALIDGAIKFIPVLLGKGGGLG
ncbi:hypothetical protein [Helicovermis profundi]|uniref:Uncharacterized protein n=1 Tax=Helicovermis profundi TaxID=3065157 RepID=A0AAU9ESJ8_9FIRM|nr:hypothetical protein HLPR_03410 [Clostridia bacterium S502]